MQRPVDQNATMPVKAFVRAFSPKEVRAKQEEARKNETSVGLITDVGGLSST